MPKGKKKATQANTLGDKAEALLHRHHMSDSPGADPDVMFYKCGSPPPTIDITRDGLKYHAVVNPVDKAHCETPPKHPIPAPSTSESRSIHDGGLAALNAKFDKLAAELAGRNAEQAQRNARQDQMIADLRVKVTDHEKAITMLANRALLDDACLLIAERYGNTVDTVHARLSDKDKAVLDRNALDVIFDSGSGSIRRRATLLLIQQLWASPCCCPLLTTKQRNALRNLYTFVVGEEPAL
ncbi:uncharacterized protein LAESUDRAFT_751704 [Laetiporus sulphureus 93-53]|uniref:Uncharacterized protein n=1 Tax=Laetiporus sulphureus 93-53 TaxID=1314785 RepID=A0A165CR55_9APHY|nr:uncharacterized protein LAESUDRAFT_751704 [Laetiporus sulphureus 93-53]KZT03277.1 hypothetical protein LAESUDRAFT_751704 [Laetiporus sulphureus 93-53]